jgi:hypothetical protein
MVNQQPKATTIQVPLVIEMTAEQVTEFAERLALDPAALTTAQLVRAVQTYVLGRAQGETPALGQATITIKGAR